MTEKYMLLKLCEAGNKMRTYQKSYFSEKDQSQKKYLLKEAKKAETEFDNTLFNVQQLIK